jgi:hypothetical protein
MTPLFKKLNYTMQQTIVVINSPKSFATELTKMAKEATIKKTTTALTNIEFVICFVTQQQEIDDFIALNCKKLKGDATFWFCYRKTSSKNYACNFDRDTG